MFNVQGQALPCGQRFLQLLRVTETVIDGLRVKPGLPPARNFTPVIGIHRRLGDMGRGDVQKTVLIRAAGTGRGVKGQGVGNGHRQYPIPAETRRQSILL